ncbi:MAG: hypothetical protein JKY71_06770 [Alphaproteobacteria bacterium]|nr:hypothetical protein [Alphaproteobacteria bacterium]
MTDENENTKPEEGEDAKKGPVLTEQRIPRAKNPAIFIVIVAVILGFGMIVGLYKRDTVIMETDREAFMPERAQQEEGGDLQNMPMLDVIRQTSAQKADRTAGSPRASDRGAGADKPVCEFSGFVGETYDEALLESIKDAASAERPYRIIKPGDMYTQDYNPTRVNINLNEEGRVEKIWCG